MKKAGKERSCKHTRLVHASEAQADIESVDRVDYTVEKEKKQHNVSVKIIKGAKRSEIANRLANI